MKSLEIVNKAQEELGIIIDLINKSIDSDYIFKNKMLAQRLLTSCELLYHYLDDYIKQDLEVLEIIKKKRVNVAELVGELIYFDNDEDVLEDYNSILCKGRQLTLTELLKLKQWLEENEDEKE